MFLPSLIVGLGATVVAFLKNRWRNGLTALALGAGLVGVFISRGDASAAEVSTGTVLLVQVAFPVYAVVCVLLALPPPRENSFWARSKATDADGNLLVRQQSTASRLGHSMLGAFIGVSPAVAFTLIVAAWAETGDEAQLAFIAIPFALIGFFFGAWAGYYWVPRRQPHVSSPDVRR